MANLKISDLTPKGAPIDPTDLFEVSVFNGIDYDTFSVSGADFPSGGGGGGFFGNETATVDSTKDFATFSMQWIGLGEFYAEATNAPTVGNASFEFAGFGVGGGDVILRESNGVGATIRESYGDLTQRFFGNLGIGTNPAAGLAINAVGGLQATGNLSMGGTIILNQDNRSQISAPGFQFTGDFDGGFLFRKNSGIPLFSAVRVGLNTIFNIQNIPTSPVGLVTGDVYSNLGVLTIV